MRDEQKQAARNIWADVKDWTPAVAWALIAAFAVGMLVLLIHILTSSSADVATEPQPRQLTNIEYVKPAPNWGRMLISCDGTTRVYRSGDGIAVIPNDPRCPPS